MIDDSSTALSSTVIGAIRSMLRERPAARSRPPHAPFVTIARQPGSRPTDLADRLLAALGQHSGESWRYFDRELIEKVATDHGLDEDLVAALPDRPRSLLEDLAEGLRFDRSRPTDEFVYGKVIVTIRALAQIGHAVIVGRGGVYCTQDLPGGVHVQLVAPRDQRIETLMEREGLDRDDAEAELDERDERRDEFYRRFWSDESRTLDRFTLALNTARLDVETQVRLIVAAVKDAEARLRT